MIRIGSSVIVTPDPAWCNCDVPCLWEGASGVVVDKDVFGCKVKRDFDGLIASFTSSQLTVKDGAS